MKVYVKEYIDYLQQKHSFVLNNFDTILSFSRAIIDKCDDDTYFWLIKNREIELGETNISPDVIIAMVFNTLVSISEELGKEFSQDVHNSKIKFKENTESTSRFITIRNTETRELKDYEFEIKYTATLGDAFHLIHEYMHKIVERINKAGNRMKDFVDVFDEASCIFAELILLNRLLEKFPELKSDLSKIIAKRIIDECDAIINLYAVLKFIEMVNSDKTEDEIKEYCANQEFSYESILECIKLKQEPTNGKHFFGLIIALNIFYTSENLKEDFLRIVSEGRNGKSEFVISKFPKSHNDITRFIERLSKSLVCSEEQKLPNQ